MGRRSTDLEALRAHVRTHLDRLPADPTLVPRHLFDLFGRSQTYYLLRLRIIPATQVCDGGSYLIDRAAFLIWVHQDKGAC
jgi:hypothetical protein